MSLHKDKFEYMCHRSNRHHNTLAELPFWLENFTYIVSPTITLYPVNKLRDLGVIISSDASWTPHIQTIANKARQKASWVLSVFRTRTPTVMLTLYKSMVRSLLEYCSPLWNPIKIGDIQDLESVQHNFISRIAGTKEMNYWERLQHLSLMSLQRRRERYIILHMWKIINGQTTNDIGFQFKRKPRFGLQAIVPSVNRKSSASNQTIRDSSFSIMGPRLWNCVPYQLTSISELSLFKGKITKFLLTVPDKPPLRGYTTANSNSILDWRSDRDATSLWGGYKM